MSSYDMMEVFKEVFKPTRADFFNQIYQYVVIYDNICEITILSNDRINDGAVKNLITKEAQKRDK